MDNSLYVVLSRQRMLFGQMDIVANNVANANTAGFKSDGTLFKEYLMEEGRPQQLSFVHDEATITDMAEGAFQNTGRIYDVAISGEGFFAVQTPLGERYTRAGNFQLNANNELVTKQGYVVQGAGGQALEFTPEDKDIRITAEGTVIVDGQERGAFNIVTFDNMQMLEKTGDGLFKTEAPALPAENFRLAHGMLESSNVNSVREMTRLIELTRGVATTSRLMSDLGEMQRNALQTIAKQS